MTQNKLSFKSENLVVDYISFNLEYCGDPKTIAHCFIKYFTPQIFIDDEIKIGFYGYRNKYKFYIRQYIEKKYKGYWCGTKINFTGKNAAHLYHLIKIQKLDFSILKNLTKQKQIKLSRFDLAYNRKVKPTDTEVQKFFVDSFEKTLELSKRYHVSLKREPNFILRIGSRRSKTFSRIYQNKNKDILRFEIEFKHHSEINDLFFLNSFIKLEDQVTKLFYKPWLKCLVLTTCHTDWIKVFIQKIRMLLDKSTKPTLVSSYLCHRNFKTIGEAESVFRFLQFLSFIRICKCYESSSVYVYVRFNVREFMTFIGIKLPNQYQLNKVLKFLGMLQKEGFFIENFSDDYFRRLVSFPYLEITKQKKSWVCSIGVARELYEYSYPFLFPKSFLTYNNKYDLRIKLKLIQIISVTEMEKRFSVQEVLNQYSVSNQKNKQIRKVLMDAIQQLRQSTLLHKKVQIDGVVNQNRKITISKLSKINEISFYEDMSNN